MNSDAKSCVSGTILMSLICKKRLATRFKSSRTANRHRWVGEYPKASERRMFKELGKTTTRNFGRWVVLLSRIATKVY